ncbi:MAG: hypothetical protein AVDCRST_MAG30-3312 [uncultured Solirubrobacteraceae bacterium]|uniref:Uncharacterized protein n=1 Tax=uncultured Solirubrobacteraceae bacterium TaxID=1162706 RepID=A0A6J4TJR2_9ACTN|nr:MAG: hypothetical protein AVDCRST_MAG30-3312 [uncultured Solirubrobacteraceae bacterium]
MPRRVARRAVPEPAGRAGGRTAGGLAEWAARGRDRRRAAELRARDGARRGRGPPPRRLPAARRRAGPVGGPRRGRRDLQG